MTKHLMLAVLCGALARGGVAAETRVAEKPPVEAVPALAAPAKASRLYSYVNVRNVTPSTMMWWLDPQRSKEPSELRDARQSIAANGLEIPLLLKPRRGGVAGDAKTIRVPEGIETLIAVEPQSALLALGSAEATADLKELVAKLDRPLRRVEIESCTVLLAPAGLTELGLKKPRVKDEVALKPVRANAGEAPGAGDSPPGFSSSGGLGLVPLNYKPILARLVEQGKAKIIASPRIEVVSGLPAVTYEQATEPLTAHASSDGVFPEGRLFVGTRRGLVVAASVIDEMTMRLSLTPFINRGIMQAKLGKTDEPDLSGWTLIPGSVLKNSADTTIKDSETIAIVGAMVPGTGKPGRINGAPAELVVLVTSRIIRTVDDPVPGM